MGKRNYHNGVQKNMYLSWLLWRKINTALNLSCALIYILLKLLKIKHSKLLVKWLTCKNVFLERPVRLSYSVLFIPLVDYCHINRYLIFLWFWQYSFYYLISAYYHKTIFIQWFNITVSPPYWLSQVTDVTIVWLACL